MSDCAHIFRFSKIWREKDMPSKPSVKPIAQVDATTSSHTALPAERAPNIHAGHRERLRARYGKTGLEGFEPHEIVELLLTFCIPREDVNEQAHALIHRFGSVAGILDAPASELCQVQGIGPKTACFLTLLPDVLRVYELDKCSPRDAMDTEAKVHTYLRALFTGEMAEKVYLLLFDNALHLLDCQCVGEGTVNGVQVTLHKIVSATVERGASVALIAHNHPGGLAIPSEDDRIFTDAVSSALDMINVRLIEHILVTDCLCVSILRRSRGVLRAAPCAGWEAERFWTHFYGLTDAAGADDHPTHGRLS